MVVLANVRNVGGSAHSQGTPQVKTALALLDFSQDGIIEPEEWLRAGQIDLRAAPRDRCSRALPLSAAPRACLSLHLRPPLAGLASSDVDVSLEKHACLCAMVCVFVCVCVCARARVTRAVRVHAWKRPVDAEPAQDGEAD